MPLEEGKRIGTFILEAAPESTLAPATLDQCLLAMAAAADQIVVDN
jgi:hypothetical protein